MLVLCLLGLDDFLAAKLNKPPDVELKEVIADRSLLVGLSLDVLGC